ncbi:Prefoldin subunit 6 [Coemansia sp. RSA 2599]|nr:Prefoldin subunit 6 [Coemansia sp. RSA 2598]KAJ1801937.1 Prefoldin subunit 6 [Coemansia sp. RSA 2599]
MSVEQRKALETQTMALQALQNELARIVADRQKLDSQQQENELVQKELEILGDDTRVYKMIGPVLVPQDKDEARANVEKRLEFIRDEIARADQKVEQMSKDQEKASVELFKLQMDIQSINNKGK